jgi:hypothetical protein
MKKMVIVFVLALAVVAAVEHKATAWCLFKLGAGFDMTLMHAPSRIRGALPLPYPPFFCDALGTCNPWGAYPGYGYPPLPPPPPPPPAPALKPPPHLRPGAQSLYPYPPDAHYQLVNYLFPTYPDYSAYWYDQ